MTVIATAGHVDHGKSSLVRALTGIDPDRFEEEKRRGLTIDLGFAHTVGPNGRTLSFVDVPGHVRFLRNMLAGVGGVQCCLFVVAATEGWKPQSEEHLRIIELLGITDGVVAVTKIDAVDAERRAQAVAEVRARLTSTVFAEVPMVEVSVVTGEGLEELVAELDELVGRVGDVPDVGRPRLWIDRVFAARGAGTVVTGTLAGGSLSADDQLIVVPGQRPVRLRQLQTLGTTVTQIGPGHRVAANLVGIDHHELHRGDALVRASQWWYTDRFDARLEVLATLDHEVSRRGAYVIHLGSREIAVAIRVIGTASIAPGSSAPVRVIMPIALALAPGDRFVVRESGRNETIGGGEILDVDPIVPAARAVPDRSPARVVRERSWVSVEQLGLLLGGLAVDGLAVDGLAVDGLEVDGLDVGIVRLGDWFVDAETYAETCERLSAAIVAAGGDGIDLASLDERERLVVVGLAEQVRDEQVDDEPGPLGLVIRGGRAWASGHEPPLANDPLVIAFREAGLQPPDPSALDRAHLRRLIRSGQLVERDGVVLHRDVVEQARRAAVELLAASPDGFTLSAFRERLATTRKYAVPLATELDARGITRRRDEYRIAGPRLDIPLET